MDFTTKLGGELLSKHGLPPPPGEKKWSRILPLDYKLRWLNTLDKSRTCKKAKLNWTIWHRALAVNAWRGRVQHDLDEQCILCNKWSSINFGNALCLILLGLVCEPS